MSRQIGIDQQGNLISVDYSNKDNLSTLNYRFLLDSTFEKRLKAFDPTLELLFNQANKRWQVMRRHEDNNMKWSIILVLEDQDGTPLHVGDWVFKALRIKRKKAEEALTKGVDWLINDKKAQIKKQKEEIQQKTSRDNIDRTKDNFNQFLRMIADLENRPVSDVTAGYPKATTKQKGTIYAGI